ncbi:hypothetical protein Taro_014736 [Colocasia esculenta]|uniref:Uncharacterized protein n=1 Tax=Colocasia esculenta TaxID=4460 RepID=A0A843UFM8_COLES|nr:hypothetical protein [Colocasia esculenta]
MLNNPYISQKRVLPIS